MNFMIGYVQLYYKIVGEKDTYYVRFDGDFGKPINSYRLWKFKKGVKKFYSKFDKIRLVNFCTRQEWELHQREDDLEVNWE